MKKSSKRVFIEFPKIISSGGLVTLLLGLMLSTGAQAQDLKQAKKRVLMLHPDKSKLDPKYFLFYKKAFDIVVQFYDNQNRQNIEVNNKAYVPNVEEQDESIKKQIQLQIDFN